jgi:hypothetical protein
MPAQADKLTAAQMSAAFDPVLKRIGKTTRAKP